MEVCYEPTIEVLLKLAELEDLDEKNIFRESRIEFLFMFMHQRVEEIYEGVSICHRWMSFDNFREDILNMENHSRSGWELDKDLLSPIGNKQYSPKTCCFLPREINLELIRLNYKSRYNRLPYTKFIKTHWISTLDGSFFKTEIQAFEHSRKLKNIKLRGLANKYKDFLPIYVYDCLCDFYITQDT